MELTYEEAKKIALERNKDFNRCNVYKDGYHFFVHHEEDYDGDSGGVVLKESGRMIGWIPFILDYHPTRDSILERLEF